MASSSNDRLRSLSHRTNATLLHTSRLLSTSTGIDNTLSTLMFISTLLHSQLTRLLSARYEKLALALASQASKSMLPGETVIASIEPPVSKLSKTCAGLKALAETSAEVWMFMRLFALLHIYKRAHEIYSTPPRDPAIKILLWAQVGAGATFQVIENIAYLASKGILQGRRCEENWPRWMALSNRFWMAQVLLEGLRLLRVRQLNWNEELGAQSEDGDEKAVKVQSEALKKRWKSDFYANAAWLPLTLHWSFEDESRSPVTETWQGVCGLFASVLSLKDAWRESA
ncbi:hypothetical protein LTR37_009321 [Vermiconidia calcicola]|uniref:Uncharacterized protein n=1 Tax=Vermiconidia calcicola TaxID=1690605 RepID=A0ACC3N868_9PEZI|nr:hypothetical protein LTR37_009321 [Vermiconidia calcicola]